MPALTARKRDHLREEIQRRIAETLHHAAGLEAERIAVTLHDTRVILAGTLSSAAHREAVILAAGGTPGVTEVQDRLQVADQTASA